MKTLARLLVACALLAPAAGAEEAPILTPKPGLAPRINGARVFGVRPGSPFLFTIAATGERPMRFAAEGLSQGLRLDPASGRICRRTLQPGRGADRGGRHLGRPWCLGAAGRPRPVAPGGRGCLRGPLRRGRRAARRRARQGDPGPCAP